MCTTPPWTWLWACWCTLLILNIAKTDSADSKSSPSTPQKHQPVSRFAVGRIVENTGRGGYFHAFLGANSVKTVNSSSSDDAKTGIFYHITRSCFICLFATGCQSSVPRLDTTNGELLAQVGPTASNIAEGNLSTHERWPLNPFVF